MILPKADYPLVNANGLGPVRLSVPVDHVVDLLVEFNQHHGVHIDVDERRIGRDRRVSVSPAVLNVLYHNGSANQSEVDYVREHIASVRGTGFVDTTTNLGKTLAFESERIDNSELLKSFLENYSEKDLPTIDKAFKNLHGVLQDGKFFRIKDPLEVVAERLWFSEHSQTIPNSELSEYVSFLLTVFDRTVEELFAPPRTSLEQTVVPELLIDTDEKRKEIYSRLKSFSTAMREQRGLIIDVALGRKDFNFNALKEASDKLSTHKVREVLAEISNMKVSDRNSKTDNHDVNEPSAETLSLDDLSLLVDDEVSGLKETKIIQKSLGSSSIVPDSQSPVNSKLSFLTKIMSFIASTGYSGKNFETDFQDRLSKLNLVKSLEKPDLSSINLDSDNGISVQGAICNAYKRYKYQTLVAKQTANPERLMTKFLFEEMGLVDVSEIGTMESPTEDIPERGLRTSSEASSPRFPWLRSRPRTVISALAAGTAAIAAPFVIEHYASQNPIPGDVSSHTAVIGKPDPSIIQPNIKITETVESGVTPPNIEQEPIAQTETPEQIQPYRSTRNAIEKFLQAHLPEGVEVKFEEVSFTGTRFANTPYAFIADKERLIVRINQEFPGYDTVKGSVTKASIPTLQLFFKNGGSRFFEDMDAETVAATIESCY